MQRQSASLLRVPPCGSSRYGRLNSRLFCHCTERAPSRSTENPDDQHAAWFVGGVRHRLCSGVGHAVMFAKRTTHEQALDVPPVALDTIIALSEQILVLHGRVLRYGRKLTQAAKSEPRIALLQTIPGIGPITASSTVATVGSVAQFKCGRDFSAWLGPTPINRSTGGKERLGRISKMRDRYIRHLMVVDMTSRMKQIRSTPERFDPWFADLVERKPAKLAAVAIANKTARIIWAVLTRNEPYRIRTV